MLSFSTFIITLLLPTSHAFVPLSNVQSKSTPSQMHQQMMMTELNQNQEEPSSSSKGTISRRNIMNQIPFVAAATATMFSTSSVALPQIANAIPEGTKATTALDGNLPDLPPEAAKSYLQYRYSFQVALDYYIFELQPKLGDIDEWGEINQLFQVNNNRGQGQPSKIERDYTNTMRIILLSMPPEESESMRDAQFKFEKAMNKITKAVAGVKRDLPVDVDLSLIKTAEQGWEEGRVALNDFLTILNDATGLNEMRLIPESGPDQKKNYGRSPRRYFELTKKTKLCQNRGGPALSQAWGQLMISGYMQENMDSCGIPDPIEYFYQ